MPPKLIKEITEINKSIFASHIVVDWEGVENSDGSPRAYTPQGVLDLFVEFPELLAEAQDEAAKVERYRVQVLEAQAGNLQPA
jgi:hypothetical protein